MQIDQSGKIETTNKHTILALAGEREFAILIPGRVKRQLQEEFRQLGKPRLFIFKVFAIEVYLLLKHCPHRLHRVIIDIEYWGHEIQISTMIKTRYLRNSYITNNSVGKNKERSKSRRVGESSG
jgi:hypothetical protein